MPGRVESLSTRRPVVAAASVAFGLPRQRPFKGGPLVSRLIYAGESTVPEYMIKGGATYRIFTDHLGSPRLGPGYREIAQAYLDLPITCVSSVW